jgi:hypothetical protein
MKRRSRDEAVFVALLVLGLAAMLWAGAHYPYDVSLFPFVMGFPTLAILLIIWIMAMRSHAGGGKPSQNSGECGSGPAGDFTGWGAMLDTLAWIVAYALLIFLAGFIVATPLFFAGVFL